MEFNTNDVLGYSLYAVAYGTSILAFLMTRIDWLRILFIVSSACYSLYYFIFPAEPLWLDVVSEGAIVVVNLFMLSFVIWASKRSNFSQPEKFLYKNSFSSLEAHEFKKILKVSEWLVVEPQTRLITEDAECPFLYCLFSGTVHVSSGNRPPVIRSSGSILGELSFMLNSTATANVTIADTCVLLSIPQAKLRRLCKSSDRISSAIDALLSKQMAEKLADSPA